MPEAVVTVVVETEAAHRATPPLAALGAHRNQSSQAQAHAACPAAVACPGECPGGDKEPVRPMFPVLVATSQHLLEGLVLNGAQGSAT
mmetsp:Transcript_707/g.952  ORF Transcript_707/g.952 Transcript_707/m.952 type:complete len:88 (-) Transcript_707:31-294(-)